MWRWKCGGFRFLFIINLKIILNEFCKSFGYCDKIYFWECELRRCIWDYCKKVKVNVIGM